jgi:hypothetical protein
MILYIIYKDEKKDVLPTKLQDVPNGIQLSTKEESTVNEMEESTVITKGIGGAPTEPPSESIV